MSGLFLSWLWWNKKRISAFPWKVKTEVLTLVLFVVEVVDPVEMSVCLSFSNILQNHRYFSAILSCRSLHCRIRSSSTTAPRKRWSVNTWTSSPQFVFCIKITGYCGNDRLPFWLYLNPDEILIHLVMLGATSYRQIYTHLSGVYGSLHLRKENDLGNKPEVRIKANGRTPKIASLEKFVALWNSTWVNTESGILVQ